ncbi:hypothetical protein D3C81_1972950 [compost metagenome]
MRRRSTDYGSQGDYRIVFAAFGHFLRDQRNFEYARNPGHIYFIIGNAVAFERVECAGEQLASNKLIETSYDYPIFQSLGY